MRKLKAFRTMELSSVVVYRYKSALAKALLILVILYVAKESIYNFSIIEIYPALFPVFIEQASSFLFPFYMDTLPIVAIKIILQTLIAINVHRIILLGTASVPKWGIGRWTLGTSHFLFYILLFNAIDYFIFRFNLSLHVSFTLLAIKLYFFIRISLLFPSIATDKPINVIQAWRLTAKYQGYMLTIILVPLFVLNSWIFLWAISAGYSPYSDVFILLVEVIFFVYIVGILSVAYWKIRKK